MKNKFGLFLALMVILFTVFIMKLPINIYKEEVLYSRNLNYGNDTSNIEKKEYITREDAVQKMIELFKDGFGINIDRNNLSESVNLYEVNGDFQWSIIWEDTSDAAHRKSYYCEVLAESGKVKYMGLNQYNIESQYSEDEDIDLNQVLRIIEPLVKALNIEVNEENVYLEKYDAEITLTVIDVKENVKHKFKIDYNNKKVKAYYYKELEKYE